MLFKTQPILDVPNVIRLSKINLMKHLSKTKAKQFLSREIHIELTEHNTIAVGCHRLNETMADAFYLDEWVWEEEELDLYCRCDFPYNGARQYCLQCGGIIDSPYMTKGRRASSRDRAILSLFPL